MPEKTCFDHAMDWYRSQRIPVLDIPPDAKDGMYCAWVSYAFDEVGDRDDYLEMMYG